MSDSLDSLDKALDAERETQQRLPVDPTDESIDTLIGTNVFVAGAPPSPPKPKKIPPQPPMATKKKTLEPHQIEAKVEVELESDDLNEIVDMTVPIQRTPELAAQFALAATALASRAPTAPTPTPAPAVVPPAPITERNMARTLPVNAQRPSSIAPVEIDITPRPGHSMPVRPPVDATQKLRAMPASPPRSNGSSAFLVASLAAGGLAIVGVVAAFALTSGFGSDASSKTTTSSAAVAPRKAEGKGVRTAVIDSPETAPSKTEPKPSAIAPEEEEPAAVPIGAIPSVRAPHAHGGHAAKGAAHDEPKPEASKPAPKADAKPAPSTKTTTASNTPAPAAGPAPAAAPEAAPAAAPRPTTGTIAVANPSLMTIVVDGAHRRLSGGRVVVQCGAHRVRVGMGESQIVNVPCGGTATL